MNFESIYGTRYPELMFHRVQRSSLTIIARSEEPGDGSIHDTVECHVYEFCSSIRKYYRTFYIGIAMVILPYVGTMGKLIFQFSLSV